MNKFVLSRFLFVLSVFICSLVFIPDSAVAATASVTETTTGFVQESSNWFYYKNGEKSSVTGIITGTVNGIKDKWYVYKGQVRVNKTGFVHCTVNGEKAYWYIKNGRLNRFTGVLDTTINGISGTYHIASGKAEVNRTDFIYCTINGKKAYYYFKDGIFTSVTGFIEGTAKGKKTGFWYVYKGKVQTSKTGFVYETINDKKAYWYVLNGTVAFDTCFRDGTIKGKTGAYYVYQGRGQYSKNGLVSASYNNEKAVWYVSDGVINFDSETIIYGKVNGVSANWYVKNGKVQTAFTGTYTVGSDSNVIKGGEVLCTIPEYSGIDVLTVNNDKPFFSDAQKNYTGTFINLSELDSLGRCQEAMGVVGQETEPTESRGDISSVYPSGWKQLKLSTGTWLYNRSHLLMFALTGLNDDPRNLITGTDYFNQTLMLGYESMALWTVDNKNAHIVYRVTPVFDNDNLVAKGVLMEAYCIEYPEDCEYCVFIYNIQKPENVTIDYKTGKATEKIETTYILNTSSKKFHTADCTNAATISAKNKQEYIGYRDDLLAMGYSPCGYCNP